MSYNLDSEAALELETIALLEQLGWQIINAYDESYGPHGTLGREHRGEVVLLPRLRASLARLNLDLPAEALALAVEELTRDRSAMSLVQANREIYGALKDGLKVTYRDEENEEQVATVRLMDWQTPENNDFLLVSQLWVAGEIYTRRADLVGFVNGLPLLFIELKASHRRLVNAFRGNFHDYQQTIPHLFWCNGLVILSNGRESRVGSVSAEWEHFGEWKRINDEAKQTFLTLVGNVDRIYRAILPDSLAGQYQPLRSLLVVLADKIRSLAPEVDISGVMGEVETLLDRSIAPQGYVIRPGIADTARLTSRRSRPTSSTANSALRSRSCAGPSTASCSR